MIIIDHHPLLGVVWPKVKHPAAERIGCDQAYLIAGNFDHSSEARIENNPLVIHLSHNAWDAVAVGDSDMGKTIN